MPRTALCHTHKTLRPFGRHPPLCSIADWVTSSNHFSRLAEGLVIFALFTTGLNDLRGQPALIFKLLRKLQPEGSLFLPNYEEAIRFFHDRDGRY
jgi:hypothetical protein